MSNKSIKTQLSQAIKEARSECQTYGIQTQECAIAWDVVEELQTAITRAQEMPKTSLERYCEENPDAAECRIYEI